MKTNKTMKIKTLIAVLIILTSSCSKEEVIKPVITSKSDSTFNNVDTTTAISSSLTGNVSTDNYAYYNVFENVGWLRIPIDLKYHTQYEITVSTVFYKYNNTRIYVNIVQQYLHSNGGPTRYHHNLVHIDLKETNFTGNRLTIGSSATKRFKIGGFIPNSIDSSNAILINIQNVKAPLQIMIKEISNEN